MRRQRPVRPVISSSGHGRWGWVKLLLAAVIILVVGGFTWRDYEKSQAVGSRYRYNLVLSSENGETSFVSFDPEEKQVFVIPFPTDLEIKSRSVGTYKVGNLYKLGSYEGQPGAFVRRKVQGFMRVPVAGYLETQESQKDVKKTLSFALHQAIWSAKKNSLSRMDAVTLSSHLIKYEWRQSSEDELVRAGVIKKTNGQWEYSQERLKQFLGVRVFDWAVGGENITVAIVNNSGVDGLGSDIAEFMSNLGFDVVAVKSGTGEKQDKTQVTYTKDEGKGKAESIGRLLANLFGWTDYKAGDITGSRAELVVSVGTDAIDLF